MPTPPEHLDQARRNERLADRLINDSPPAYLDWAVTTAFYAAVHYVKYFRASQNLSVGDSHDEIHRFFRTPELRLLQRCYRGMEDDCWAARYQCSVPTPTDAEDCVSNSLARIRQHILGLYPPPA